MSVRITRTMKYEVQIHREGEGWTNDIWGAEDHNEYSSLREAKRALAHFRRSWPDTKKEQWRIADLSVPRRRVA